MTDVSQNKLWGLGNKSRPGTRLRLFCFPYAGGGASIFRLWSTILPPEIEVVPVQLPGRENRLLEQAFASLPALIEELGPLLRPYLDLPYAFFGHSMGALICFELAHYLRDLSCADPVRLLVSARPAPQLPDLEPPVHHLDDATFLTEVRRLGGTPEEILQNAELLELLLPLLRADFALCETYEYRSAPPLACPISAFGGLVDLEVSESELAQWEIQTASAFRIRFFEGGHFFLHERREDLLKAIASDLLEAL